MSARSLAAFGHPPHVAAVVDPFMADAVTPNSKTARAQALYPVSRANLQSVAVQVGEGK